MVLGERDFRLKHIPGSINVFLPLIKPGTDLLSPDDEVVVYCSGGPCVASTFAYQKLIEIGFQNVWAMSLSLLKFVGQASLVDDAMLPS